MTTYTGGCLCGAVRYEIAAEPIMAGHCQCRDCQRHTGTGHASMIAFPKAAIRMTGEPKFHACKADSGNTVRRGFCAECGSSIMGGTSGMPDMMMIAVGTLDDPGVFKPQMAVYASRGSAWDHLDPGLPRFPLMPPMGPVEPR